MNVDTSSDPEMKKFAEQRAKEIKRKLYEVWEIENPTTDREKALPVMAQMHNFIAHFKTKAEAESYILKVKENRGEIPRVKNIVVSSARRGR